MKVFLTLRVAAYLTRCRYDPPLAASEVVQAAADFHHRIVEALRVVPKHIADHTEDLHASDGMSRALTRTLLIALLAARSSSVSSPPRGFFFGCLTSTPSGP